MVFKQKTEYMDRYISFHIIYVMYHIWPINII